ncbi:MAG: hypothetical protein ACTIJJ_07240 [Galactobacter sp.]
MPYGPGELVVEQTKDLRWPQPDGVEWAVRPIAARRLFDLPDLLDVVK